MKKIKVKQIASSVRRQPYQRKNLIGLGLNKLHKTVELDDTCLLYTSDAADE